MLYDAHGRKLRRAIGYLAEYREVEEAKHDGIELADCIGSGWEPPDSEKIPEEL
jgi:hypothetical protein